MYVSVYNQIYILISAYPKPSGIDLTKEDEILQKLSDAVLRFDFDTAAEAVRAAKELMGKGGG